MLVSWCFVRRVAVLWCTNYRLHAKAARDSFHCSFPQTEREGEQEWCVVVSSVVLFLCWRWGETLPFAELGPGTSPLFLPRMNVGLGGKVTDRGRRSIWGVQSVPEPHSAPQMAHVPSWKWTRDSAVGSLATGHNVDRQSKTRRENSAERIIVRTGFRNVKFKSRERRRM